jgi:hypothetical protein
MPTVADIDSTEAWAHITSVLNMIDLVAFLWAPDGLGQPRSGPCTMLPAAVVGSRSPGDSRPGFLQVNDGPDTTNPENWTRRRLTDRLATSKNACPPSSVGRAHPW